MSTGEYTFRIDFLLDFEEPRVIRTPEDLLPFGFILKG